MASAMCPPTSAISRAEGFYKFLCVTSQFEMECVSESLNSLSRLFFKDPAFVMELIDSTVSTLIN